MKRYRAALIGLAVVAVLASALYASLPLLVAGIVRHQLASRGFSDIRVQAARPRWDGVQLHGLTFATMAAGWRAQVRLQDVAVRYTPRDLFRGRLQAVHIASATVTLQPGAATQRVSVPPVALALFLPQRWLARLPVTEGSVDQLSVAWANAGGAPYVLNARAHLDSQQITLNGTLAADQVRDAGGSVMGASRSWQVSVNLSNTGRLAVTFNPSASGAPPVLSVTAHLQPTPQGGVAAEGELRADMPGAVLLVGPLLHIEAPPGLQGRVRSQWQVALTAPTTSSWRSLWAQLSLRSKSEIVMQAEQMGRFAEATSVDVTVSATAEHAKLDLRIEKGARLKTRLRPGTLGAAQGAPLPVTVTSPAGAAAALRFEDGRLAFAMERGSTLAVSALRVGGLALGETRIELTDTAVVSRASSGEWDLGKLALAAHSASVHWRGQSIDNDGATLRCEHLIEQAGRWSGTGELTVAGLHTRVADYPVPRGTLRAEFQLDDNALRADARLATTKDALVITSQLRHDLATGSGAAKLRLTPLTFAAGRTLSQLLAPWPYPIDLHGGRCEAEGTVTWKLGAAPRLDINATARVTDLSGQFRKAGFAGLSGTLVLSSRGGWHTVKPLELTMTKLNPGIPLETLRARLDVATPPRHTLPVVNVAAASAQLLGGKARTEPFQWDTSEHTHRIVLVLEDLSLADIVALERQPGLAATGTLSGRLPVEITRGGVALQTGELRAHEPGGHISYVPSGSLKRMAESNQQMRFVLDALSNFHYHTLQVSADSTPKGDVTLHVMLQGANPDWQSGRPVHLNLNVQENIPTLLRSLRLADELGEALGKKLQQRENAQP